MLCTANLLMWNDPERFVAITELQSSVDIAPTIASRRMPALLTRIWTP